MAIVSDDGVFETELEYTAFKMGFKGLEKPSDESKSKQGTVGTPKTDVIPEPPKETLTTAIDRAIDDISMLNPGFRKYKQFRESDNVDNRIETPEITPLPTVTQDIVDQTEGKFINPAHTVTEELPVQLGAQILNEMILKEESKPRVKVPKEVKGDELGKLIDDLKKKRPEHFPKPKPKIKPQKASGDIETASPLVTITQEDINTAISAGMAVSGGGLVTKLTPKAANANTAVLESPGNFGRSLVNQKIVEIEKSGAKIKTMDYEGWNKIAEELGNKIGSFPNGFKAAKEASKDGSYTMVISPEGRRDLYHNGKKLIYDSWKDMK
jgi:hypothetical protein